MMKNSKGISENTNLYGSYISFHELTFSCFRTQPFFSNDRSCTYFSESVNESSLKYLVDVISYVIMPTHVHLFVHTASVDSSIQEFIKSAKQSASRKELSFLKRNDASELENHRTVWKAPEYLFWQRGGGYDRAVFKEKTGMNIIQYIHNNPVRKGYVNSAVEWKWSSARCWMCGDEGLIKINKSVALW